MYHTLFDDVMRMLREGVAVLEKQIFDHKVREEGEDEEANESMDISQMLGVGVERRRKKKRRFKKRHMIRNPGIKEG